MPLTITSAAFAGGAPIPRRYTCDGDDVPPPLSWTGAPDGTRSFVLIIDDPDAPDPAAPKTVWVHWVLYDIPANVHELPDGGGPGSLPTGAREGKNGWNRRGYGGPCPPIGRHRYFHKLYALDTELGDLGMPEKAEVERAMEGHVLEQAELMGTYERGGA